MPETLRSRAPRKPEWLKVRAPSGESYARIQALRRTLRLATVCEEARCPNLGECWGAGTATFMLLGDTCTRACRFCNVKTGRPGGRTDPDEPKHLAEAVSALDLSYVVLTMVDRDDLPDGGAAHVRACVEAVARARPAIRIEVLMGDFQGREESLAAIAGSPASVLAHNVETVRSRTRRVRDPRSGYELSLAVLARLKSLAPGKLTKSSLMLGLGEREEEVRATLRELRASGVELLTLGQYLQPSPRHLPVLEFVPPQRFEAWREEALGMGFLHCSAGPLVRSSYKAGELFVESHFRARAAAGGGVLDV
jgi:lipoic acid synthetase